jgi:hypothetical protein
MPACSSMTARDAVRCSSPGRGIAACSVPMAMCRVRRYKSWDARTEHAADDQRGSAERLGAPAPERLPLVGAAGRHRRVRQPSAPFVTGGCRALCRAVSLDGSGLFAQCNALSSPALSGPVLLVGALFAALTAAGVIQVSLRKFDNAVGAMLILALLSLVPEIVWKRYAR